LFYAKFKNAIEERRFADIFGSQRNTTTLLRGILENDSQNGSQQRHHCLTKCTASQGEYLETDSSR
jgi:hypothetical protein